MNFLNRIRVRIKRRPSERRSPGEPPPIEVREIEVFICKACHNKYHAHHWYCPQCLGEVHPLTPHLASLRVVSIPEERMGDLTVILQTLTGRKDYEYLKAFHSLPWIMIAETEHNILQHWKEVLLAEKIDADIQTQPDQKKKIGKKTRPPIFKSGAPLPFFLSPATQSEVRAVSKLLQNTAVRLKWVDMVLMGHRIVEGFYKRNPAGRILFSDFLFQIDHDLHECCRDYHTYYRMREEELSIALEKMKQRFLAMEAEIHEVRKQVESQL
jgi:hypothetical protein